MKKLDNRVTKETADSSLTILHKQETKLARRTLLLKREKKELRRIEYWNLAGQTMDGETCRKYRQSLESIKAKVDDKPPRFNVAVHLKTRRLRLESNRIRKIDRENVDLLKSVNRIMRLGGKVDCWAPKVIYKSKFENQGVRNRIITNSNRKLLQNIRKATSEYSTVVFLNSWNDLQSKLKFKKHSSEYEKNEIQVLSEKTTDQCMFKDSSVLTRINPSLRSRCFFDIEIQESKQKLGTIVFVLYNDLVPKTCANFEEFCRGTNLLSYKNTPFHRIVAGYWCQGGDVTKFNGTEGASIYGDTFEDENFDLCHAVPGILSTCSSERNANNSKFNLTFKRLETMDGKRVVFGRVVSGLRNIYKIEEFGTKTGKPIKSIIISNCGIL